MPSDSVTSTLSGNPDPVIVRVSPPAISMSSVGETPVTDRGSLIVIYPGIRYSPYAFTITSNVPTAEAGSSTQVICVDVRV